MRSRLPTLSALYVYQYETTMAKGSRLSESHEKRRPTFDKIENG